MDFDHVIGPRSCNNSRPAALGDTARGSVPEPSDTSLADRYLAYRLQSSTTDPWSDFDHLLSEECDLRLNIAISDKSMSNITVKQAVDALLYASLRAPISTSVDLVIERKLCRIDTGGRLTKGTASLHVLLPSGAGREVRNGYVGRQYSSVPAATFEMACTVMPEVAHTFVPIYQQLPRTESPELLREPSQMTVRRMRLPLAKLLIFQPRETLQILTLRSVHRILTTSRNLHSRLLNRPMYRRLWFDKFRGPTRRVVNFERLQLTGRNRWLPAEFDRLLGKSRLPQ